MLCKPILNHEGELIGVAQIINKKEGDHEFTETDEVVSCTFAFLDEYERLMQEHTGFHDPCLRELSTLCTF